MTEKQKLKYITERLFPSKKYSYDILLDLYEIIIHRLILFKNNIDEFEKYRAENYLQEIKEVVFFPRKQNVEYTYRLYIISGIQFVSLCCVDLSNKTIENIMRDVKNEFFYYDHLPLESLDPNAVSTIYIFKNNTIIYCDHFFPAHLTWISQCLYTKNIVDYKSRDKWIVKD